MKATQLRANLYQVLSRVIATGVPAEIELRGQRLEIRAKAKAGGKLARLVRRPEHGGGDLTGPTFDEAAWRAKWSRRLGRTR